MQHQPAPEKSVRSQDSEVAKNETHSDESNETAESPYASQPDEGLEEKRADGGSRPTVYPEDSGGVPTDEPGESEQEAGECTQKSENENTSNDDDVEPIKKEETVPKSLRLSKSAFDALKSLAGKYGKTMVETASIAIIAYAKQAAAAPIVRYRIMDDKILFALQAAANDIKAGLNNLLRDLYTARKSNRDPHGLKALYAILSEHYQRRMTHAEKTLTLMDKECLLHDLLEPADNVLLIQALERLERVKPKNRTETQMRDLHLKIYKVLLR